MKEVGSDETRTAEGGVAARDGGCHHAKDGQHRAYGAHPACADLLHHNGWIAQRSQLLVGRDSLRPGQRAGELHGSRCPDEGHDALRYHCSVEDGATQTFMGQASGHERALGSVEAADGTARYRDAQHWEDGQSLRVMAHEVGIRQLGHPTLLRVNPPADADGHQQQGQSEDGIDAPDEFVDGQQSGKDEVEEDGGQPEAIREEPAAVGCHVVEQGSRCGDEHRAYQHQQHQRTDAHHEPHPVAQLVADDFGQRHASLPDADHAAEVVVNCAGEDASEHYPEVGRRSEQDAHDGSEDGSGAGDVEELDEEDPPCRHGKVVHAVLLLVARHPLRLARTHDALHDGTVDGIAQQQANKGK